MKAVLIVNVVDEPGKVLGDVVEGLERHRIFATTELTPSSNDDLALLKQRGLITMNDGEPVLTDASNSVIDRSGGTGISDE